LTLRAGVGLTGVFMERNRAARGRAAGDVFDLVGHRHPAVHPFLVHREAGTGEGRVREGADRDADEFVLSHEAVEHRGAAVRAEGEAALSACIARAGVVAPRAGRGDRFLGKRACTPNTLPVRRWQARQWQTDTRIGSPSTVAVS
jgi:hypothetical protein